MKLDYHLLSVLALLCICQFGFSDTQQIVGSENAANVGRDLDLYFLDDEDSREPLNAHHVSKREAVPSRKAPKKKKESASPAESLMGSGDSEDSDDTEDSSRVFTPPSDDEDGEDIDGSGDIFSVKPKSAKKPRVSTPPPIRGENSRPSASTPSSSTTSTTTSTAMPPTTSTTTEEPATSTAVPTTMRTPPSTKRPLLSTTAMPEDDEDSEDDGDYEGSGAGESPIVKGHVNVPKKPYGANRHSTAKPKNGDKSILPPRVYPTADYGDFHDDGDLDGDDDDDEEEDSDDDFSLSTPRNLAPTSTVEPPSTTSTTTPSPTTTTSSTTTEISTSTPATEAPKSTTAASLPGVDDDSLGGDDDDEDDDDDADADVDDNEDNDDALRKNPKKHNKDDTNNNGVDNTNSNNNDDNNKDAEKSNNKQPPKNEDISGENEVVHDKEEDNLIPGGTSREVHLSRHKATQRPSTLLGQPGILVAIMGGAVVGLLLAILCVMFVVYRMRKKDEGSFPLGKRTHDDHFSTHRRHYMRPSANKEFYA